MFSKESLEALPEEAKQEIADLTEKLKREEISYKEYKETCTDIIREAQEEAEETRAHKGGEVKRGRPPLKEEQKPEYISDIIQYAGVNLKEEAMQIAKEAEVEMEQEEPRGLTSDFRNTPESLFDTEVYTQLVGKICKLRSIGISEKAVQAVFQASRRKLTDLLEKLVEHSKARTDLARADYLIRIENDKRRQMWYLEQEEKLEMDKYKQKKDTDEGDGKKKWRKLLQEREDLIIKKRLSNNVALAALGSQRKSWMDAASSPEDEASPYLSLFQGSEDRAQKGSIRAITKEDFLSVLSRDKRYNKSVFTIRHTYL
ncbi:hypothetical protein NECID01_1780 [Nematocida sp. AWRm77]|nr:hypothetical protein NECID01_1780 [Nematocida sp. AWRm77]